MKRLAILLLLGLAATGCLRNDIRTVTFQLEELNSYERGMMAAKALKKLDGIIEIRPDMTKRTLTVVFNGRNLYLKNVEYALVDAGFDLPNRPAGPKQKEKLRKGASQ